MALSTRGVFVAIYESCRQNWFETIVILQLSLSAGTKILQILYTVRKEFAIAGVGGQAPGECKELKPRGLKPEDSREESSMQSLASSKQGASKGANLLGAIPGDQNVQSKQHPIPSYSPVSSTNSSIEMKGTFTRMQQPDQPRAVLAGTTPYRYMIEATFEVQQGPPPPRK